jgi:hypothetical protein
MIHLTKITHIMYKPPESGGLYTRSRDGAMQGAGLLEIKTMRSR